MTIDMSSELLAPSGATLKFEAEGDIVKIRISGISKQQTKDFVTGEPAAWDDGNPKMQWVISGISNGEESRLFLKDWGSQRRALIEALRKAGVEHGESLEGGTLTVKWESTDEPSRPGLSGAKQFRMKYERPASAVVDEDLI